MEERASISEVEGLQTCGVVDRSLTVDDDTPAQERKDIRIWMDGAFDMMHFGHMNAFRQGRALGT
jgi:bifunctional ADP-heptose synthase (sugar kinase/adenylyltransferase)